jgi:hypothetical protein
MMLGWNYCGPQAIPLFPGHPLPELAWSEMRYTAYSFVMPRFKLK